MSSTKDEQLTVSDWLASSTSGFKESFEQANHLLSMSEYLEVVAQNPVQQCRDSARYLRDCMDHFGTEQVYRPYGSFTRFKVFDCEYDNHREALIGQEAVQEKIYGSKLD